MPFASAPQSLWVAWLRLATLAVAAFGAVLVIAPDFARQGFSLLVYADRQRIDLLGPQAVAYIALVHAVLGSVMFGWGLALWLVVRGAAGCNMAQFSQELRTNAAAGTTRRTDRS